MLIHGRRGLSSPLLAAWELARAWRDAELRVIENSGHTADGDVLEIPGSQRRVAAVNMSTTRRADWSSGGAWVGLRMTTLAPSSCGEANAVVSMSVSWG